MARYSDQCRREGELSAPEAAQILGVTSRTLCRWARDALAGEPSILPVEAVRRDIMDRCWFAEIAIARLLSEIEARRL